MPVALERKLRRRAQALRLSKARTNAYVYGTLRRTGWTPRKRRRHKKKK